MKVTLRSPRRIHCKMFSRITSRAMSDGGKEQCRLLAGESVYWFQNDNGKVDLITMCATADVDTDELDVSKYKQQWWKEDTIFIHAGDEGKTNKFADKLAKITDKWKKVQ